MVDYCNLHQQQENLFYCIDKNCNNLNKYYCKNCVQEKLHKDHDMIGIYNKLQIQRKCYVEFQNYMELQDIMMLFQNYILKIQQQFDDVITILQKQMKSLEFINQSKRNLELIFLQIVQDDSQNMNILKNNSKDYLQIYNEEFIYKSLNKFNEPIYEKIEMIEKQLKELEGILNKNQDKNEEINDNQQKRNEYSHTLKQGYIYLQNEPSQQLVDKQFMDVQKVIKLDDNLIASGGFDGQLRIWNVKQKRCIFSKQFLKDGIWYNSLCKFTKDQLILGYKQGYLILFNFLSYQSEAEFDIDCKIYALQKIDDDTIALGGAMKNVQFLKCSQSTIEKEIPIKSQVYNLKMIDQDILAIAGCDINLLNCQNYEIIREIKIGNPVITIVQLNSNQFVFGDYDKHTHIYDIKLNSVEKILPPHSGQVISVQQINQEYVISSADDKNIQVGSLKDQQFYQTIKLDSVVQSILYFGENNIVCCDDKGNILIWKFNKISMKLQ